MAVFKVLCFIGFVLLSCGHARKHGEAKHRLYHPRHLIHRHKHIVKRHLNADGFSVRKSATKRSEKVEEWEENGHRPTAIHRESNRFEPIGLRGKGPEYEIYSGPGREQARKEPRISFPGSNNLPGGKAGREREKSIEINRIPGTGKYPDKETRDRERERKVIIQTNRIPGDHNHIPYSEHPDKTGTTHPEGNGGEPNPEEPGGSGEPGGNGGEPDGNGGMMILTPLSLKGAKICHRIIRQRLNQFRPDLARPGGHYLWWGIMGLEYQKSTGILCNCIPTKDDKDYLSTALVTAALNVATISTMFKQEDFFLPSTCLEIQVKREGFDKFTLIITRRPRCEGIESNSVGNHIET